MEFRWTPVTDRMPPDKTTCLVTVKAYGMPDYVATDWAIHGKWNCHHEVLAWMLLPDPYKTESAERIANADFPLAAFMT